MGHFHVVADLTGPTGLTESVEMLVDTGATFLAVPASVAERLELTPCLIVPAGAARLGAVALESLLLAVDPVAKRLVPTDGCAMGAPA